MASSVLDLYKTGRMCDECLERRRDQGEYESRRKPVREIIVEILANCIGSECFVDKERPLSD